MIGKTKKSSKVENTIFFLDWTWSKAKFKTKNYFYERIKMLLKSYQNPNKKVKHKVQRITWMLTDDALGWRWNNEFSKCLWNFYLPMTNATIPTKLCKIFETTGFTLNFEWICSGQSAAMPLIRAMNVKINEISPVIAWAVKKCCCRCGYKIAVPVIAIVEPITWMIQWMLRFVLGEWKNDQPLVAYNDRIDSAINNWY